MKEKKEKAEGSLLDKKSIGQLEDEVRGHLGDQKNAIMDATIVLLYLRDTKRYKENKRYAKERFDTYIDDQFGVRMGTFRDWVRAIPFQTEARAFGVGLVAKSLNQCGPVGAKRAFDEIMGLEDVKKKVVPREKIDEIIIKNRDPKRMKAFIKKVQTDWKSMYEVERKAHEATREALMEARARIAELEDQIGKLKSTADRYGKIRKIMEGQGIHYTAPSEARVM